MVAASLRSCALSTSPSTAALPPQAPPLACCTSAQANDTSMKGAGGDDNESDERSVTLA